MERARGPPRPSPHKGGRRAAFGLWEVNHPSRWGCRKKAVVSSGEWLRESMKMVHRAYPAATIECERLGCSWQRLIKLATSGYGRSASSALKRRPESGAPGRSLAEASAGEQRRFSCSFYLAKGWRSFRVTGRNAGCVHHTHRCLTCTTVQGPALESWNEHLRMLPKDSSFDRARLGDQPRSSHLSA
jgi:hypothetical protein